MPSATECAACLVTVRGGSHPNDHTQECDQRLGSRIRSSSEWPDGHEPSSPPEQSLGSIRLTTRGDHLESRHLDRASCPARHTRGAWPRAGGRIQHPVRPLRRHSPQGTRVLRRRRQYDARRGTRHEYYRPRGPSSCAWFETRKVTAMTPVDSWPWRSSAVLSQPMHPDAGDRREKLS